MPNSNDAVVFIDNHDTQRGHSGEGKVYYIHLIVHSVVLFCKFTLYSKGLTISLNLQVSADNYQVRKYGPIAYM